MVAASETAPPQAQSGKSPNSKEASPSKENEQSPEELKASAFSTLAAGKRHLLVADIPLAVSTLGEACELLSKVFGETATEMAEVYFYYGKSLLELARLESGVLGNALDGVPEEEDAESSQVEDPEKLTAEEKDDVEEKVEEAFEENFEKHDKIAKIHKGETDDGDGETEESGEDDEEAAEGEKEDAENGDEPKEAGEPMEAEAEKETGESDVEGGEKEGEDQSAQDAEEEEDPSNLQLAWEMLELAKVVYQKTAEEAKADSEMCRKLCETYMVLGEVSLENENYPQACEDLSLCLKRRLDTLPADSRSIAETHYQLGIAQGFDMKYEEAVVSLEAAISVLEARIAKLQAETESPDDSKKEVEELRALVPEIREKITDTNEMKDESIRKMKEAVGFTSSNGAGSSEASGSGAKPIASIAIKRKADDKPEDKATDKEAEAKKPKEDGAEA